MLREIRFRRQDTIPEQSLLNPGHPSQHPPTLPTGDPMWWPAVCHDDKEEKVDLGSRIQNILSKLFGHVVRQSSVETAWSCSPHGARWLREKKEEEEERGRERQHRNTWVPVSLQRHPQSLKFLPLSPTSQRLHCFQVERGAGESSFPFFKIYL